MRPYQTRKNDEALVVKRGKFLTLLQTALNIGEWQFARQAALIWLASYPGDLLVNYSYASALNALGDADMAIAKLENILRYDPEFTEAVGLLSQIGDRAAYAEQNAALAFLRRTYQEGDAQVRWLGPLVAARQAYESGDLESAEKSILAALAYNPGLALPAIFHMRIVQQSGNMTLATTLANIYTNRWPDCLQIKLLSAMADLQQGEDTAGVEKLHWSAAHDISGQVINRLLGPNHAYRPLWPEDLKVYLDLPIPASIAGEMGMNILGGEMGPVPVAAPVANKVAVPLTEDLLSDPTLATRIPDYVNDDAQEAVDYSEVPPEARKKSLAAKSSLPEFDLTEKLPPVTDPQALEAVTCLTEIQAAFDKVAHNIKKTDITKTDGRFPVYVLLTSRAALEKKYGQNTANVVIDAMGDLSLKITELPNWNSAVFVPDDPTSAKESGLEAVLASDAWKIKLSLSDLDAKLSARGEMIGALLIVGGNDIVPFHMLPNPTDDSDASVPSDNPYATIDENYYIQQWPVGRIPDESGNDAGYLLEQLRFLNNEYNVKVDRKKSISASLLTNLLGSVFTRWEQATQRFQKFDNIGVTAEVWKIPSTEVFSVIDRSDRMRLSPPVNNENLLTKQKANPKYAYFNLHGIKDSAEWFGQRDLKRQSRDPEYPVAMVPANFTTKTSAPDIIMSEACYGANIIEKKADTSVALNFLASGSRAFVGSTCIAYGSVNKPLIAADFLAYHFWTFVKNGIPVGYALMQAKLALAKHMTATQGYLDGEDQKTILSFVCFGDPLVSKVGIKQASKPMIRPTSYPNLKTISDSHEETVLSSEEMPAEILSTVKTIISTYLPGLDEATVAISPQLTNFSLDPEKVKARQSEHSAAKESQRYVVTLKKTYEYRETHHDHFARFTFDSKGEILKMSSSR